MPIITGFTDTPISKGGDDTLEISHYLKSLAAFILKCETPLTISIQGEWGTGKTSAMNIIKETLDAENIPTVWFNTWQFSQFSMQDYLPISMLNSLVNALGNPQDIKGTLDKVWAMCAGATKFAVKGASMFAMEKVAGGAVTGMVFGPEKEDKNTAYSPLSLADDIRKLKEGLAANVKNHLKAEKCDRMVVFIDDLDRLEPSRAVELLEVLKNFLDVPGCVFVMAVDHSVVEQGIKAKFGLQRIDRKGRSFFDKIIQLSFNLPIAQYNTKMYVKKLIDDIGVTLDNEQEDVSRYVKLISASVGFNPRGMKRIFNLFQLLSTVAANTSSIDSGVDMSESRKQQILFGLLCLQTSFPEIYTYLAKDPDSLESHYLSRLASDNSDDPYPVDPIDDMETEKKDRIAEMIEFMEVFNNVLDIDGNGAISDEELECLRSLLRFSAITSHDVPENSANSRRREKLSSFSELKQTLSERSEDRSLALSIYEVLDRSIEEYARSHHKPYKRNITTKANVTYNVDRSESVRAKGRKAVNFLYTYAQAGGVAVLIGKDPKITLQSTSDVTDDLIKKIFDNYDSVAG
jgi:hypothetical protein